MFNPFGSILPPECVLFCSQAALGYPKRSILATPHYLNTFWLFYFILPQTDSHAMCKDTGKPTDLIRWIIKLGDEMGLVCINICKTQYQLAQYCCWSQFLCSHSQWPHPFLAIKKYIFLHCNCNSKNPRLWNSNIANKLRQRCK